MQTILYVTAILTAGLMTGNELAVGAFVHPQIARLDDAAHAKARQAFARVFGKVMPLWYALTAVLAGVVAWTLRGGAVSHPFHLALASALLWCGSIVYTIAGPVPINNRIAQWQPDALPPDWKAQGQAWDRLHAIRIVILVVALACLVSACLAARPL